MDEKHTDIDPYEDDLEEDEIPTIMMWLLTAVMGIVMVLSRLHGAACSVFRRRS